MDDWVTSLPTPHAVTFKYGKKSALTSTFPVYSSQHASDDEMMDSSTVSPLPLVTCAMNAKRTISCKHNQQCNPPWLDTIEKKRKAIPCTLDETTPSKGKPHLKGAVANGHIDDLNYLFERIRSSEEQPKKSYGFTGLEVEAPGMWNTEDRARFDEWMARLGFTRKVARHCTTYRCSNNAV